MSSLILFCLLFGFFGMAKAYENTRQIGFGEYKKAVAYEDGVLRIFDFELPILETENQE